MISVQEAHRIIRASIAMSGAEELALEKLPGRVLSCDMTAPFPLPRFTNAAMDGFAVKFDDIRNAAAESPVTLRVMDRVKAGHASALALIQGSCMEIMTGAPIPDGADTVVAFEDTSGFGTPSVEIRKAPKKGANVRKRGEEVSEGEILLEKGMTISPSETAVLASFGYPTAPVMKKPRVSIVTVGDELKQPGTALSGADIYNCNSFMLEAACRSIGLEVAMQAHAPDDRAFLRKTLSMALTAGDFVITAGGISTGEYDFVQEELSSLGVEKKFWSVSQKPGKPIFFGTSAEKKPVFSLPGNPVSALVCFAEYCVPVLFALQGKPAPAKLRAVLSAPFPCDRKRHRFLLGRIWAEDEQLHCRVSQKTESHMITSSSGANCIIEAAPASEPLRAGSPATCTLLPWACLQNRQEG
ncbi:MAG: molybdopterin molybdotransferase MoeA [Chlorobiaceae bacterium]|nr:molybdopterin molybdotransferase MoeA [Chlorobiaceae bacterium]